MITQEIFSIQNPWRSDKSWASGALPRQILPTLTEELTGKKILGLIGSRQVEKSSLLN